jgi:hypothetical protein
MSTPTTRTPVELRGAGINLARAADGNAEFVLGLAGRDLGVGLGSTSGLTRIEMSAGAALAGGDAGEEFKLGFGFDVDAENALLDRKRELARGLADTGEHDLLRRNSGGAGAQQLAPGDDVGAGAEPGQRRDHRLVGIRLHGVADQRVDVGEGVGKHPIMPLERRARIAIERRADGVRQRNEIDRFGVQHAVAISEVMHGTCLEHEEKRKLGVPQDHAATPGAPDYCSSGSSKNDFFSPGGATGLPWRRSHFSERFRAPFSAGDGTAYA